MHHLIRAVERFLGQSLLQAQDIHIHQVNLTNWDVVVHFGDNRVSLRVEEIEGKAFSVSRR